MTAREAPADLGAPGVQPHGLLLVLDDRLRVVAASANTEDMLGVPVDGAVDAGLGDLLGADAAARVARRVAEGFPSDPLVVVLGRAVRGRLGGVEVDVRVHPHGPLVLVELEDLVVPSAASGYRSARTAVARLARQVGVAETCAALAREVADLTGFEQVLVHRFRPDETSAPESVGRAVAEPAAPPAAQPVAEVVAEVVAEAHATGQPSLLGLHHALADLPAEPPETYVQGPPRLVVDVTAESVPLTPYDDGAGEQVDLARTALRSPAPGHLARLATLGVTAALTLPLVVDDTLWGLVVGQQRSGPHRPSHDARAAAELVVQVAAHQLSHRERVEARDASVEAHARLAAVTTKLTSSEGDVIAALFSDPGLLTVLDAAGAALFFDGVLHTAGRVPEPDVLHHIAAALDHQGVYVTATAHLAGLLDQVGAPDPPPLDVAGAAGALRIGTMSDRWGLWLRPEQTRVATWGVGPGAAPGQARRVVTTGHSRPWQPGDVEVADELGRHVNSMLLLRSREQVAMAESMQRTVVLDRAPGFPGVELVARYRPATTYELGGDWWDAFELPGGRLALVVGDVAGHGVAAASAMTQVRTALRAYLFESGSPAACLDRLDRLMDGLLDVGVATAVVAVLDLADGDVELACAGHPRPLVLGPDGARILEMDVRPLLGVGEGSAPTERLRLAPDELLVLYTDGLVERRGFDLGERTERFRELAATRGADESVDDWADRLFDVLDTTDDDTTLLAVRREPAAGPLPDGGPLDRDRPTLGG